MTMNTLDSSLAESLRYAENAAAGVTATQHDFIVGRVRSRRRRAHATRGTVVVASAAALAFGTVGIGNAILRNQNGLAPAGPSNTASNDGRAVDPAPGAPVTLVAFVVDRLDPGALPDTPRIDSTVLVHISADRARLEVTSLSNYGRVASPECAGGASADNVSLDDVYLNTLESGAASAAACAATAISQATGVHIDGTITVDFGQFVGAVNDLGGVDVCVAEPIDAPYAKLHLAAGPATLDGATMLGYIRARSGTGLGDGSDNPRTDRSAVAFAAIARAMAAAHGTLPADAVTTGVAADPQFRADLATVLSGQSTPNVAALSAPLDLPNAEWGARANDTFGALAADEAGTPLADGC